MAGKKEANRRFHDNSWERAIAMREFKRKINLLNSYFS